MWFVKYSIAESKCSILALLDLSAAFDTVVHHTLLCDLASLGTTGFAVLCFKTYFADRKSKFIVNDKESDKSRMNNGIQQCTILVSVFFIIYTSSK